MFFLNEFLCFFWYFFVHVPSRFLQVIRFVLFKYVFNLFVFVFLQSGNGNFTLKEFREKERERERANSYAVVTWPGTRRRALPFAVQIVQRMLISSYRNVLVRFHSCCVYCFQMFSALLSLQVNTVDFLSDSAVLGCTG